MFLILKIQPRGGDLLQSDRASTSRQLNIITSKIIKKNSKFSNDLQIINHCFETFDLLIFPPTQLITKPELDNKLLFAN